MRETRRKEDSRETATNTEPAGGHDDGELVPEDDRVIGRAFRRSLVVIVVVALAVAAVLLLRRPRAVEEEPIGIPSVPPVRISETVEPPEVRFTDVTTAAGIDYVHFTGATGDKLLPETMGGGGGFVDYDGDGRQDIVLIGGTTWPHEGQRRHPPSVVVYRNAGSGRFEDRTASLGLAGTDFYGMGFTAADYDGDGRTDLFVTAVGRNHLFRNTPGGFVEVTVDAGVGGADDEWSTGAAFFDYDNDGDLDLFVCNYVRWSRQIDFELDYRLTGIGRAYGPPLNYEGTYPYLYRNQGDGTFADVSAEVGVEVSNPATGGPVAKSLAVSVLDADLDGWLDLVVANDTVQNFFFHNRGDGTFEESGEVFGLAYDRAGAATGAMGLDAAYYRNNDEVAFAMGNFANEMTSLYVSQGDPRIYADEAIPEGVGAPTRAALSFGVLFFDYDADGWLDLLQNNGHLEEEIGVVDPSQSYEQPVQLFWNSGAAAASAFVPVPVEDAGALATPVVGRGSAYADVDGDGDLDLLLMQVGGRPLLLRNDQALGHHWLRLRLVGRGMNRDAIGARVEVVAGGVRQRRTVAPVRSYLSQVELPLTFGLGRSETVESVVVHWPDGSVAPLPDVEIDRSQTIEQ
jgi:hypothetical protein